MSEPEKALCRLAAALTVQSEELQAKIVRQEDVDQEQLVRVTNSLTRTLDKLRAGKRAARKETDLRSYLASKAAAA